MYCISFSDVQSYHQQKKDTIFHLIYNKKFAIKKIQNTKETANLSLSFQGFV